VIVLKNAYYEQLINLALDFRDKEWFADLIKNKQQYAELEAINIDNKKCYSNQAIALDDMKSGYAIIETEGIRNINWSSEYDVTYKEIIEVLDKSVKKGETVTYKILDKLFQENLRYYLLGYMRGMKIVNN
jgi:hypothetical protein